MKHRLYTVPFSKAVPTPDGEHHFLGIFVRGFPSRTVESDAVRMLRWWKEEHDDGKSLLYNPPLVEDASDEALDELINSSQIHLATPTEIQCSNFADNRSCDHKDHKGDYIEYHLFHWDQPEEFFDGPEYNELVEELEKKI
jgi:hypothetical protein